MQIELLVVHILYTDWDLLGEERMRLTMRRKGQVINTVDKDGKEKKSYGPK